MDEKLARDAEYVQYLYRYESGKKIKNCASPKYLIFIAECGWFL